MEFFTKLFDTSDFPARWTCGRWSPGHGWLHILSDLGIWSAYFAIPVVFAYFLARRKDLPFRSIFLLFAAFIVLCGTTHLMEVAIFWWPAYRLAGVIKLITAVVSWATVFALVRVAPNILAMRSPDELEREIVARKEAERQLQAANEELERRVGERTGELAAAVADLRAERELLSTTLASIGDAVVTTDTEGRVTGLNPVAESLTGWAAADAVGQPLDAVFIIVNETTRQPVENPVTKALREGAVVGLANHTVLIGKGGVERPIDDSAAPIRHKEGGVVGCVLVFRDISERKRAEDRLREQTATLRAITDTTTDLIFVKDRDCRLTFANPATLAVLGLTEERAIGRDASELYADPSEGERITANDRRIMAAGVSETVEELFTGPLGTRTFLSTKTALRDGNGAVVGIVGVSQDITDLKRAEAELREREAFIGGILGSITDAFFVVGKDWRFTFANDESVRRFGRRRDEIVGVHIWDEMFPAAKGNEAHARLHRAMADRAAVEYEVYYEPWRRWFLDKAFPTDDGGLAVYSRDITDRKRDEERFRLAAEAVNGIIYECDFRTGHVERTRGLYEVLGYQPHEVPTTGEWWVEQIHPDDRGRVVAVDPDVVRTDNAPVEYRVRHKDGRWLHVEDRAVVVRGGDGRPVKMVGCTVDVTARKRAEALLAGQRQVLEMVATGRPLADVLAATCRVIEGQEPGLLCSVLLPDERGRHIGLAVGPSLPDGHIQGLEGLRIAPPYIGSCGEVLDRGEAVVVSDVQADERFAPEWRALLLGHGLRACRSVPVFGSGGTVLASFALYRREPGDPAPANSELVQTATQLAGIAVERRRGEAEREAAQRTLSALVERCPFGIYIVDADFRIASMNAGSQAGAFANVRPLLGRPFDEAMRVLWPEPVAADIIGHFRHTLDTGEPYYSRDFVNPRADIGQTEAYEWELHRVALPGGRDGVVCYYYDSTELRQAERRVGESEERLRLALSSSDMMAWETDLRTGLTVGTEGAERLWGFRDGSPADYYAQIHPDDRPAVERTWQTARDRDLEYRVEYRVLRPDGEKWYVSRGRFIRDGGRVVKIVGITADLTWRRQVEQALEEANRQKDEFLATLAHELRNPLAPVRNSLQIMKLAGGDSVAVEKARGMMERQVGHMTRLIEDLMDLSRISRGKIVLQKARMRLADAVQDAVDTARPLVEERGHELVVDVPPEPIFVDGDRTRLAQVFGNLLNNAAKYTGRGGRIRLAVERQGSDVVVTVEDNGVGIPAPMLNKVFEMFTQVDRSLERSQGGLGIGLNIVKRLVEKHDGSVTAESGGEGEGSRFVVRLPVVLPVTADRPDQEVDEKAKPAARRILVADDNRDGATSLAEMLQIMGNETRTAFDGLEAVELAEAFRPDVILLDIGMPRLSGYDACRRIREQPWGRSVVMVAQTGWGQDDDKRKSLDAGFDFHMVKPVDPAALEKILAGLPATTG